MPGSDHHYGVVNGAVIRDWYCDICGELSYSRMTCLQVPRYPLIICTKCEKAQKIAEGLMDTVGIEYPYGIYKFRDHLSEYLRSKGKNSDRPKYYYSLSRTLSKSGMDLKKIEEDYQQSIK